MKIIICGAGRVGLSIASYLCMQNNHVTVIDNDIALVKRVINAFDINGIHGHASRPDVLKKAGAENADVIIAVTDCDEVNIVACQVAHSIFGISRKIARIRDREYRNPTWANLYSRHQIPIDVIISPEEEIASTILNRMNVQGTTNDITLADNSLHIFGIICTTETGFIDQTIKNIDYHLKNIEFTTLLVIRNGETFFPEDDFQVEAADEIYCAVPRNNLFLFLSEIGIDQKNNGHIVICGGGEIGLSLGESVLKDARLKNNNLILIERDLDRGRTLNRYLENALVINGSAMEHDILKEANVDQSIIFVSVMDSNENNILSSVIAKKMGAQYTLALSTNKLYNQLLPDKAIDAIINPEAITISRVLHYLRKGRIISVNTLRQGYAELIEAEVSSSCGIVNIPFGEINLPPDIRIVSVYRPLREEIIFPKADTIIEEGDIMIVLSRSKDITEVEKLFSFSIDLF